MVDEKKFESPLSSRSSHENVVGPRSANEGAQSVAEAVKRVADAAVAAVASHRAVEDDSDFSFSGSPGGTFVINGPERAFSSSGTVLLNGQELHATGWSANRIEGRMPADARPGRVEVWVGKGLSKYGYFRG